MGLKHIILDRGNKTQINDCFEHFKGTYPLYYDTVKSSQVEPPVLEVPLYVV